MYPHLDGYTSISPSQYMELPNNWGNRSEFTIFTSVTLMDPPSTGYHVIFGDTDCTCL